MNIIIMVHAYKNSTCCFSTIDSFMRQDHFLQNQTLCFVSAKSTLRVVTHSTRKQNSKEGQQPTRETFSYEEATPDPNFPWRKRKRLVVIVSAGHRAQLLFSQTTDRKSTRGCMIAARTSRFTQTSQSPRTSISLDQVIRFALFVYILQ